jgi:hypothetical protein
MAARRALTPLTALLLLSVSAVGRGHAMPDSAKTLTRFHDPVVVSTAALVNLPGRRTTSFRLYRVDANQLVPIPLQFDARDRHGDLVVDGPDEFDFDDNDDLVFMAKDSGDRAHADHWPADCDADEEVAIIDPLNGARGWVYLTHFTGAPPPAEPTRYVSVDRAANRAQSSFYEVDYAPARNFYTGMRVMRAAGGNEKNLLRQTRMRGSPTLSLFFNDFTFEFTEQNAVVEIDGVRMGPVRAVRRVRLSVDLGPLFPDLPTGTAYTYHYQSAYLTPTRIGFPWIVLQTLRDFHFENLIDFDPRVIPMRYWDGANVGGLVLAAQNGARVETGEDHDWWVHSGEAGTVLHAFVIPETWRQWGIVRGTVFKNGHDAGDGDAPQRPDAVYAAGYSLLHMTQLREARTYDLLQAAIVLPRPYRPGDEVEPMAMLRAPLQTEIRRRR